MSQARTLIEKVLQGETPATVTESLAEADVDWALVSNRLKRAQYHLRVATPYADAKKGEQAAPHIVQGVIMAQEALTPLQHAGFSKTSPYGHLRQESVTEKVTGYTTASSPEDIGVDLVALAADNQHILSKYLEMFRRRDTSGDLLKVYDHARTVIPDIIIKLRELQGIGDLIQQVAHQEHMRAKRGDKPY